MTDILFPFVGGIGLFLVGMMLLSEGLVAFAGPALRGALIRFTGTMDELKADEAVRAQYLSV